MLVKGISLQFIAYMRVATLKSGQGVELVEENKKETALEVPVQEQKFSSYLKKQEFEFINYLESWSKSKRASFSE